MRALEAASLHASFIATGRCGLADNIVLVVTASAHREAAFRAAEFLMDYLKTRAPFWKRESGPEGSRWVEAEGRDAAAGARWAEKRRSRIGAAACLFFVMPGLTGQSVDPHAARRERKIRPPDADIDPFAWPAPARALPLIGAGAAAEDRLAAVAARDPLAVAPDKRGLQPEAGAEGVGDADRTWRLLPWPALAGMAPSEIASSNAEISPINDIRMAQPPDGLPRLQSAGCASAFQASIRCGSPVDHGVARAMAPFPTLALQRRFIVSSARA